MIVLDASVLIAFLERNDALHRRAVQLLDPVIDPLGVSPLTLAEILVGPARVGRLDDARAALRILDIREVPWGTDTAVRLATHRARTDLKLPDCVVLLAAEDTSRHLATFDRRLAAAARSLGLSVLGD